MSPDQMMMNMAATGGMGTGVQAPTGCPVMHQQDGGSGGQNPMDFQEQFETDPKAFMERMSNMSGGGGSCPFMASSKQTQQLIRTSYRVL